jgi:hypothetical protein
MTLRWSGDLSHIFLGLGSAPAAFGLIIAGAVARGAWFGPTAKGASSTARGM